MSIFPLLRATQPALAFYRNLNCWTAGITKKHRKIYEKTYPTILVLPDGSSINIDYHEPRKIIVLPVDVNTLSEQQRKELLVKRIPRTKITLVDEVEDDYDASKYY